MNQNRVSEKTQDAVKGMSRKDTLAFLSMALLREADRTLTSRYERIQDSNLYDNLSPVSQRNNYGGSQGEAMKLNTVREKVLWTVGHIADSPLISRVMANTDDPSVKNFEEMRHWQVQTQMKANPGFDKEMKMCLSDAAITGEGIARIRLKPTSQEKAMIVLERRPWEGIFYDHNYRKDDFRDCPYLFDLRWVSIGKLKEFYKKKEHHKFIDAFKQLILNDSNPDQRMANFYASESGWQATSSGWMVGGEEDDRLFVLFGEAWWREYSNEKPEGQVKFAKVVASPDFSKVEFMTEPAEGYKMNEIPYVRIVADRYRDSGFVYSPIIRFRRPMETFQNEVLRAINMLATRRKVAITTEAMPEGERNVAQMTAIANDWANRAGGSIVLKTLDPKHFQIIDDSASINVLTEVLKMVREDNERNGGAIDPSLLGRQTNVNSAVGLQEKAHHASLAMPLVDGWVNAHQLVGDMFLGLIGEFEDVLEFPPYMDMKGDLQRNPARPSDMPQAPAAPSPEDMLQMQEVGQDMYEVMQTAKSPSPDMQFMGIDKQRCFFKVSVVPKRTADEAFQKMMFELSKSAPDSAAALLVILGEELNIIPAGRSNDVAKVLLLAGHNIPMDGLPMRDQQEIQNQLAQRNKPQEEARQAEMQKIMTETQKALAMANKLNAEAQKVLAQIPAEQLEAAKTAAETNKLNAEAKDIKDNPGGGGGDNPWK